MNDLPSAPQNRPDDSGYNNPSRSPSESRRLTEKETAEFMKDTASDNWDSSLHAEFESSTTSPVKLFERTRRFFRGILALLILGVSLLGLFLYATALSFIARVGTYPLPLQIPVWILLFVVLVLVVYATVRLIVLWRSLQRHPQVTLTKIDLDDPGAAKEALSRYLKHLLERIESATQQWNRFWPDDPGKGKAVEDSCRKLVSARHIDAVSWLEEYEESIREPMDQAAAARINRYWRLVGIKTAISPFPLVDSIAVLYNNFLMIGDLATLYGRRISRHEIIILMGIIIFQVYIATHAQEVLDSVADEMTQTIQSGVARSFTQFFSPKLAEGAINAMVTWRIGKRARQMMSPVKGGSL